MFFFYSYGDSIISSGIPLKELPFARFRRDHLRDVEFVFNLLDSRSEPLIDHFIHQWGRNNSVTLALAKTLKGFLLQFPNLAEFDISEDLKRIDCRPSPGASEETVRHLLLDQVLPRLFTQKGRLALHASSVRINDGAVAFLGKTGGGKSTLAAGFESAGYSLLSDDGLLLDPREDGVLAVATYCSLRLWPDAITGLYATKPVLSPVAHYSDKQRIEAGDRRLVSQALPIRAVYVLTTDETPDVGCKPGGVSILRLAPTDSCMAIIQHAFQLDISDPGCTAALLDAASRVSRQVPFYSLSFPRDFVTLPDVVKAIANVSPNKNRRAGLSPTLRKENSPWPNTPVTQSAPTAI